MPPLPIQNFSRRAIASQASRWTSFTSHPRIPTRGFPKINHNAHARVFSFKPTPQRFSQLQKPSLRVQPVQSNGLRPKVSLRTRFSSFASGAVLTIVTITGSLYFYYSSFFTKVPITNRERILWFDSDQEEEMGWAAEHWILVQQNARPRLEEDSAVVKLARDILGKLMETHLVKGLELKLYVVDDYFEPYACSVPARKGGRIFINTGELYICESVEEIAGVFAHEIAHILARHIPERRASEAFARSIAQIFGWNAALGSDLISWRTQEQEADHIGLMLMAQAGFEPNARVEYFEKLHSKEREMLNGRDPMPETMSTHPSHESRIKSLKSLLPEANAILGKTPKSAQAMKETWEAARPILINGMQAATAQIEAAQQLQPELLLLKIEDRLARLEDTFMQLSAAISMIEKGKEEVLGKTLYAVAKKQRELWANAEPKSREEEVLQEKDGEAQAIEKTAPQEAIGAISEGASGCTGAVDEAVPKEAVHPTTQVFPGLKEAAAQTTLASNASRTPIEEKDGTGNQGEENSRKI